MKCLPFIPAVAFALLSAPALAFSSQDCRCLPGDSCWPDKTAWDVLNSTVGGRLVATVPVASVCHDPHYDEAACAALRANWTLAPTHYESSSSVMEALWANRSCDPFTDASQPCVLGNYVSYSVNASCPQDIVATINFAKKHNIRFIVRNTAHDFLGRSTGAGALAAWTHYLKDKAVVSWSDAFYTGPALKMGAGLQGFEAIDAAGKEGLVVVGGFCPTVGIAGGYIQGGGHSHLSTKFGLAADQTLEFEVVTAGGGSHLGSSGGGGSAEVVTASRTQNADLYWALSGGGAGTYGVVTSVTVRAYPDAPVGGVGLFVDATQMTADRFWAAVGSLWALVPQLTDAGLAATFLHNNSFLIISAATAYNQTSGYVRAALAPFTDALDALAVPFQAAYTDFPTYGAHWAAYYPAASSPVGTFWQFGGRLVPRVALELESNRTALVATMRYLADNGVLAGVTVLDGRSRTGTPNAVLPAWRAASALVNALQPWDFDPAAWDPQLSEARRATAVLGPRLDAAAPGSGNYGNEADPFNPDWKTAFYGTNYDRLLAVKHRWDPDGVLYGRDNVGSDAWTVADDGRMCRAAR